VTATRAAGGFLVSLFGVRLAVVCDSPAVAALLDRYVLPWLPRTAIGDEPPERRVEVRCSPQAGDLQIVVDGTLADAVQDPLAAVAVVQRALDEALVQRQSTVAVVHGGVVGHDGRAILLPGPTGAGKSTLVAELVRQGARYLSDEYALIDEAGRVHPYPRPLLLRDGSSTSRPMLAAELGGSVGRGPMPATLVLGLWHATDAPLNLVPLSQGDGVLLLLRNTPQAILDRPWILPHLERAMEGATCYTGRRGEARETAIAILRLAASGRRA
jgi:hypothetical protein